MLIALQVLALLSKDMTQNFLFKIELTLDELNAVLIGIQEIPAKIANPLDKKIRDQAQAQVAAQNAEAEAKAAKG